MKEKIIQKASKKNKVASTQKERLPNGRPPTVLTDDQIVQVEAYASVLTSEQIADMLGICRATFYNIMQENEEVFRRYNAGRANAVYQIAAGLKQRAIDGCQKSSEFYLSTQAGWSTKSKLDLSSNDGTMTPVVPTLLVEFLNKDDVKKS